MQRSLNVSELQQYTIVYVSIKSKYKRLTSRDFMFNIFSLSVYDSE